MGQISLPRFNRLNTSMAWESMLNTNQYHWLSTKIYLFLRLYLSNIFKVTQYNFFNIWGPELKINMLYSLSISNFIKKKLPIRSYFISCTPNTKYLLNILALYINRVFEKSYIYLVYNHHSTLKTVFKTFTSLTASTIFMYLTNFKFYLIY